MKLDGLMGLANKFLKGNGMEELNKEKVDGMLNNFCQMMKDNKGCGPFNYMPCQ